MSMLKRIVEGRKAGGASDKKPGPPPTRSMSGSITVKFPLKNEKSSDSRIFFKVPFWIYVGADNRSFYRSEVTGMLHISFCN